MPDVPERFARAVVVICGLGIVASYYLIPWYEVQGTSVKADDAFRLDDQLIAGIRFNWAMTGVVVSLLLAFAILGNRRLGRWVDFAPIVPCVLIGIYTFSELPSAVALVNGERASGIYIAFGLAVVQALAAGQLGFIEGEVEEERWKTCPDCAESVLAEALVCKHCGRRFRWTEKGPQAPVVDPPPRPSSPTDGGEASASEQMTAATAPEGSTGPAAEHARKPSEVQAALQRLRGRATAGSNEAAIRLRRAIVAARNGARRVPRVAIIGALVVVIAGAIVAAVLVDDGSQDPTRSQDPTTATQVLYRELQNAAKDDEVVGKTTCGVGSTGRVECSTELTLAGQRNATLFYNVEIDKDDCVTAKHVRGGRDLDTAAFDEIKGCAE